ncbi:uncharacterized protein LOC117432237 [Acipenser ruthenus]|uniref:uncharacterized protein LOC117432237 n=1 Tax=Acipenser ruthenus TaxID=7906 RepID=UPI002742667F|nr:uncharacterized protein LOC117432237 [Acipenser ruthenus]XP_033909739.3 uncharacterized protein LOC117432237 [Acipenser ruthenus]XP_058858275.1 uncharacterized protein LOC117432237 [Acipenser ruthenus]
MDIPVVNFNAYKLGEDQIPDERLSIMIEEIKQAFTATGFVFLENTGIEQQEVNRVMDVSKKFFLLQEDTKKLCARNSDHENFNDGWVSAEIERLNPLRPGDLKEAFNVSDLDSELKCPSDAAIPEFREVLDSFFRRCKKLALRVLEVTALCLGLERDFFVSKHRLIGSNKNCTTFRTLYYPPLHKVIVKPNQIRCGEHSDYGSLTLLFQDESGGLEVMNRSGQYISAPCIPGTVLVNIADLMQRWTSDVLVSTFHRVVLPSDDKMNTSRQSMAFFVHPDNDEIISCCDGSSKYPPVNALQYTKDRAYIAYKDANNSNLAF